jgi:hypothetical protein
MRFFCIPAWFKYAVPQGEASQRRRIACGTLFLLVLGSLCHAAILPDMIAAWQRGTPSAAPVPEQKVWDEYGLKDAETVEYTAGAKKFLITAWRFGDATGAMAAFDEIRPADARPSALMGLSAETADRQIVAAGNYLFLFKGARITPEELSHVVATVPQYEHSPLPSLPKYLPAGQIPGSERYIVGPSGLAQFVPSIPSSTAAFHFSAEGQLARYGKPGKETTIVIFSYPTMEMARDRYPHFQEIPGAMAKRTGPLVAVALNASSPNEAENLLSQIKYEATVTVPEHPSGPPVNAGTILLNAFIFCAIVLGFCIAAGVLVGGLMMLLRRSNPDGSDDNMVSLHLSGKQ